MKQKTQSCIDLHYSMYLAPDQIRTCCKRFFVNGEMKGDVPLVNIGKGEQPSVQDVLKAKRDIYEQINRGEESPCSGCPWLTEDEWPSLDTMSIRFLSVEAHSVCNLKCTYCSDTYYGGKNPNYDVRTLYEELKNSGYLSECKSIAWGGGEPLARKDFASNIITFTEDLQPTYNKVFTNGILYSPELSQLLALGKASITTSIDAGTEQTYLKVRGADRLHRVLGNLQRYLEEGAQDVTIKYIFTDDNTSQEEVARYVELIKQYNLTGAAFQISSDFKHEVLSNETAFSAIAMYVLLRKAGVQSVYFDDHLRPRITKYARGAFDLLKDQFGGELLNPRDYSKVVVWGAGQYSGRFMEESIFFSVVDIEFFVDSDPRKVGKQFFGKTVKPVTAILESELPIFIGASGQHAEICHAISELGADESRILNGIVL